MIAQSLTRPASNAGLEQRLLSFVVEQHTFAFGAVREAYRQVGAATFEPADLRRAGRQLEGAVREGVRLDAEGLPETTPMVSAESRFASEVDRLCAGLRGFFEREALRASLTPEERRWMLEGIVLTRAVDNRMKQMFLSSELKYGDLGFQGKGFRSLGQEAIYAAGLRLRRGPGYEHADGWRGDIVAPLIRDLGIGLAFTDDVVLALNAQAGKSGPPMEGRNLHFGDLSRGVLPAAAPLPIAACTAVGMALAMKLRGDDRVALTFIGEGGSSLGEWHEAINLAAARKLPVLFCVQNNQTALSTKVSEQSNVRVFADKALGYGIDHVTIDGTDPEAIATAFDWAAERARQGDGPALIELVTMRMCGHAHHDDMLYLGGDPPLGFELPPVPVRGYADAERYRAWAARDPLASYSLRLIDEGVVTPSDVEQMKARATQRCDEAMEELVARPWPDAATVGRGVTHGPARFHDAPAAVPALVNMPEPDSGVVARNAPSPGPLSVEAAPAFDAGGSTYLEAIGRAVREVLDAHEEAFVIGEDVGPPYGNAFLLLKEACEAHPDRVWNAPIAESGIIGAMVGAALDGALPLGEMQFNDFVASGFNQLVNNAAKFRYRTGHNVPMVLRMPWGGLRRAGPYHSQDTSPWFYRTPGLKIVAPSTPHDARALLHAAARDPDPVLFFEHIGLYRDPKIKQPLGDAPADIRIGTAALRRAGDDLSILSYGAYVHRAMAAARTLEAQDGIGCDVLDLRSLAPVDWPAIEATVRRTGRVLLVGEDSKTRSILESVASKIGESLFEHLDGPVRVLGALDVPVPYAPSLEDAFLIQTPAIVATARNMLAW